MLTLGTSDLTNYEKMDFGSHYHGNLKILMISTASKTLKMSNGMKFHTGNHPVEMLVPLKYFEDAGFETVVATPGGKPVALEMWAFPEKDENINQIYNKLAT